MGVATGPSTGTLRKGLRPQNQPKKVAHLKDLFGQGLLVISIVFQYFLAITKN